VDTNNYSNAREVEMTKKVEYRSFLLSGLLLFSSAGFLLAQEPAAQSPAADNTKMNQPDRSTNSVNADKQSNDQSDRNLTQQVRQAIVADKSLSTYAHNVKVITQNGQVTLKGPVRSDDEKRSVEAKAATIAGESKVTSELTIKPKS
jgi:hyperosmotically inducible periplasmic protein